MYCFRLNVIFDRRSDLPPLAKHTTTEPATTSTTGRVVTVIRG